MHINALKTQLMHKNVQTNPEKSQKIDTTLLLFYADTRKNLKAIRGNGYHFVPKGRTFPTETITLITRSSGCEKHILKPAPNGTKKLPRHVDATP